MNGTMEITTKIGCAVQCRHCPQSLLVKKYFAEENRPAMMSMETFVQCIDKIPTDVTIDFAGMCEPWLNPDCTQMVEYAAKKGHPIRIYTTLVGMTSEDIKRLSQLEIEELVLHLPDTEGNAAITVDNDYFELLMQVEQAVKPKIKGFSCHGTLSESIQKIVGWKGGSTLVDRAGNLDLNDVPHQHNSECAFCERSGYDLNNNILLPDGSVALCCMDYGLEHIIGNLTKESYTEILNGHTLNEIRKKLKNGEAGILCRKCSDAKRTEMLLSLYMQKKAELREINLWTTQQEEANTYLKRQAQNKDARIAELENWSKDAEAAKAYLETQVGNKDARIAELEGWTKELEAAKKYLEGQVENRDSRITELVDWIKELEKAKEYLKEHWDNEIQRHEQAQKTMDELQELLTEKDNTIAKQTYKLNLLLNDKKIQKIIAKKRYEI